MNSPLNFAQQDDVFSPAAVRPVTLIGAGSVGSQVAVMLAKIGVTELSVWDADFVESHNIPMSAFRVADLGKPKVKAIGDIVLAQSGLAIDAHERMYGGERLAGSVVACVDSMEARRLVWDRVKMNPTVDILVDTRIAVEYVVVLAVDPCDPEDAAFYEEHLYPSSEALRPTCGRHGIVYVSAVAAAAVCANLTAKWSRGRTERHFKMLVGALQQVPA